MGLAPGLVVSSPDDVALFVGELLGYAHLVALVPVGLGVLCAALDAGQGDKAVWLVDEDAAVVAAAAFYEQVAVPQVAGGAEGAGFAAAPPQCIVAVVGALADAVALDLGLF